MSVPMQVNKASATIKINRLSRNGRFVSYAQLCWKQGREKQKSISLGKLPEDSCTPLLDIAVMAAFNPKLSVEELERLLMADKSARE